MVLSSEDIMQLIQSLIWLLAGVGVFIVGMNFMSDALEKSAGDGMKKMLGRISNNRFSGVSIGAGVTAIIQPIFLRVDVGPLQEALSPETQATSYAWKTMLQLGIPIAIGTDSPVEDLNPFMNLYTALKRRNPKGEFDSYFPEQQLTIEEAIDGYTLGSAYAEGKENQKGRLKPGYQADMVLLDRNIFDITPEEILETRVLKTFVDGELLYQAD